MELSQAFKHCGEDLIVKTNNLSEDNFYIQDVKLNVKNILNHL